jgi:hypothetical protein
LHLKEWKIPNIIAAVWFSAKKKTGIWIMKNICSIGNKYAVLIFHLHWTDISVLNFVCVCGGGGQLCCSVYARNLHKGLSGGGNFIGEDRVRNIVR